MRGLDPLRRHPLCRECGYDLVATVAANRRRCPECGAEFDLKDLDYEARPGDWTLMKAVRRALAVLLVRSLLAFVMWCGVGLLQAWLISVIGAPERISLVLGIVAGFGLGAIMNKKLTDQIGFESVGLIAAACLFAVLAVGLAQSLVEWFVPSQSPAAKFLCIGAALMTAWVIIIYNQVMEHF